MEKGGYRHEKTRKVIKNNATVFDAVELIKRTATDHKNSKAVRLILSLFPFIPSIDWFAKVHNYLDQSITYEYDEIGREQIKTPDRFLIKDAIGDCDDFSVLWSALLKQLQIRHYIKIVKYAKGGSWAHVYVTIPRKSGGYLTLDNVAHKFGKRVFEEVKHVESKVF
jgi:hypothetical protein